MGAEAPTPPNFFLWSHGAPLPGRATRAARALEAATRTGRCATHAYCALPTGIAALVHAVPSDVTELAGWLRGCGLPDVRLQRVRSPLRSRVLVSHLDAEPVRMRAALDPREHPLCSLGQRAGGTAEWLDDRWIDAESSRYGGYFRAFPALRRTAGVAEFVAESVRCDAGLDRELDHIEDFASGSIERAAVAVLSRLESPGRTMRPVVPLRVARLASSGPEVDLLGLRLLAGLSSAAVAARTALAPESIEADLRRAKRVLSSSAAALVGITLEVCGVAREFFEPWTSASQRAEAAAVPRRDPEAWNALRSEAPTRQQHGQGFVHRQAGAVRPGWPWSRRLPQ
ncbi:MAG: hypothetical protein O2865_07385 [Planctomycetota bacterium]|nr:hypothetical protein [Planctomycetota bacterium]MDA0934653.1 hypothetical protein [Planctomycetota bacterium]MDA1222615.1 hypothetical protein [Planctomycetota bacterium]